MTARHDPLRAVARVRRVREQDSRLGLVQASRELDEARGRLELLQGQLSQGDPLAGRGAGSAAAFVAHRTGLVHLTDHVVQARESVDTAASVAASATAHWQSDRSRLKAIELLQDRRAEERRAELQRAEAAALDEIATQAWARAQRAARQTPAPGPFGGDAA